MTKAEAMEMFAAKRAECQRAAEQNERDKQANLGAVRVMDQLIATVETLPDDAVIDPDVAETETEADPDEAEEPETATD